MSVIADVVSYYFPEWDEPYDHGGEWLPCLCPWHGDEHPSASISPERNAFNCSACGKKGDVISIIRTEEGVTYQEALDRATELSPGCDPGVLTSTTGKSRRGVSRRAGSAPGSRNRAVRSRVRGEPRRRA